MGEVCFILILFFSSIFTSRFPFEKFEIWEKRQQNAMTESELVDSMKRKKRNRIVKLKKKN